MAGYEGFAPFYDRFQQADYRALAGLTDRLLTGGGAKRALLLDLGCGTGSLSLEMAGRGYEVIGVDASDAMLALAQQKAEKAGVRLLLLCQRMEELDLYGTVDHCVCMLDSLNHLTDVRTLSRALGRVALFLAPGGRFVFDVNTPYKHAEVLADNCFVYERGRTLCVWRNRTEGLLTEIALDFFTEQADSTYTRCSERFCERAYPPEQLARLLAQSGLRLLSMTGEDGQSAPCDRTERIFFVAEKERK